MTEGEGSPFRPGLTRRWWARRTASSAPVPPHAEHLAALVPAYTVTTTPNRLGSDRIPGAAGQQSRKRLLCFIVAYNAENTIRDVLSRIPLSIAQEYDTEILVIDDASTDRTFECSQQVLLDGVLPLPLKVLFNPVNQGYGGNQKIGYHYAIKNGFDYVALIHGDGQYAPESLPALLRPLREGVADASFGSRMLEKGSALKAGMPLYKFVGNKILTWIENRVLETNLSEFHSGYRLYSVEALKRIPFHLNSNGFSFDTDIIIQLVFANARISETPIPTYYGDEICHVNGLKYAWDVVAAVLRARAHRFGIVFNKKFDCSPAQQGHGRYQVKFGYESPHSIALDAIPIGARVLDLGCAGGYVAAELEHRKRCRVTAIDCLPLPEDVSLSEFHQFDLNKGLPDGLTNGNEYVLMLDVIEHLNDPEAFAERLYEKMRNAPESRILVSTGNIGFVVNRLMLLLGRFDYGGRGILDRTHTRLFTFKTLCKLLKESGFDVVERRGIPVPLPLIFGDGRLSRMLMRLNKIAIALAPGLFSYQMFVTAQPRPSLEFLLAKSEAQARLKAAVYRSDTRRRWAVSFNQQGSADDSSANAAMTHRAQTAGTA